MTALLALIPILLVLELMLVFRWGSHLAGLAGWVCGLLVALLAFGLNWQVFWVSQVKGLLLSFNVLLVLWPAILLYNVVDQIGGIRAIALALQGMVYDKGWLLILQAWMLTAVIESLAGFGMPIAIVAPMLMVLGVTPVIAVAAAAVGHTWAVSLGGMALPFRTLAEIVKIPISELFPTAALLLGIAVILTGLSVAFLLKQKHQWWRVLITGSIVAGTQYLAGLVGMTPISSLIAAVVGFITGSLLCRKPKNAERVPSSPALLGGLIAYGTLVVSIILVSLIRPLNKLLTSVSWTLQFPAVESSKGLVTAAGPGYLFHFLTHPGILVILSLVTALIVFRLVPTIPNVELSKSLRATIHAATPASLGTLFMIGLSTVMEHTGMTLALANGLSALVGGVYPLVSPIVGMLGAFATGSNTNSNVLFGMLQKEVATLVGLSPVVILAAQTTGGALGSMIAPAKLAVGSSTNSLKGHEGEVLRITLPICLAIALIIGLVALFIS